MNPRLAIVGAGKIVPFHIDSAKRAGFKITCISASEKSINAKKISKDYNIPNYFLRTIDLIESDIYDAILVAIPPNESQKILSDLVQTNKPVLIEKPVALNSQDLMSLKSNKNIYVGYNRRFYKSANTLKKLNYESTGFFSFINPEILNLIDINTEKIKNTILHNSVHFFDLIRYLLGEYELKDQLLNPTNSLLSSRIYVKSNYVGELQITFNSRKNSTILFENNEINAIVSPLEKLRMFNNFEIYEPTQLKNIRRFFPTWNGDKKGRVITEPFTAKPGFNAMYKEFSRIVTKNQNAGIFANLNDAFEALKTAEQLAECYSKATKIS